MGSRPPTLYDLLQVRSDATTQDLRNAWRRLAQEHHPDRGGAGDPETMTRINQAYEVLSDPDRRARYDQQLLALRPPRRRRWTDVLQHRARWLTAAAVGATVVLAAGAWTVLRPGQAPVPSPRPGPGKAASSTPAETPLTLTPSRRIEHWPRPQVDGAAAAAARADAAGR